MMASRLHLSWHVWVSFLAGLLLLPHITTADEKKPEIQGVQGQPRWGPFRSNLYFGLRPRVAKSAMTGLMWTRVENGQLAEQDLRHTCEQTDHMLGFGWDSYDHKDGGTQVIRDPGNKVDITTDFLQIMADYDSWAARVKGELRTDAPADQNTSVVFYIGVEDDKPSSFVHCTKDKAGQHCNGATHELNGFSINLRSPATSKRTSVDLYGGTVAHDSLWQAKSIFLDQVKNARRKRDLVPRDSANMYFVHMNFQGPFEVDIIYNSSTPAPINFNQIKDGMSSIAVSLSTRFRKVFPIQGPFKAYRYWQCSSYLLGNLLGSLNYFYGDRLVDVAAEGTTTPDLQSSPAYPLLSFVPSRSAFPRGFLWDEGFHMLVAMEWDLDLCLEVLSGWLALVDSSGWIAREQIFGDEARSKVPADFQPQHPYIANPPTLFMVISTIIDIASGHKNYTGHPSFHADPERASEFLIHAYPILKKHYEWFRNSQSGDLNGRPSGAKEGFRWRGATNDHILASGLDDYPRPTPPQNTDLHVDALSWVALMAEVLEKTAFYLKREGERFSLQQQKKSLVASLEALHWSDSDQAYCDAAIQDGKHVHVCHKGYVSLIPFVVGAVPHDSPHIPAILKLISDEKQLGSPHGVRSLSQQDPFYGKDDNYWRGAIWVNINYLILEKLLDIATSKGPHSREAKVLYQTLRERIVDTVVDSWQKTGFAWEQYNPKTGAGQRSQAFTGWTALAVKIMSMPSLDPNDLKKTTSSTAKAISTLAPQQGGFTFWSFLFLTFVGLAVASFLMPRRMSMLFKRGFR